MKKKLLKEFYFGYDLEEIVNVMEYVKGKYEEGEDKDFLMWMGYGDDVMNCLEVYSEEMLKDVKLVELINECNGKGEFNEEDGEEDNEED